MIPNFKSLSREEIECMLIKKYIRVYFSGVKRHIKNKEKIKL